ncbi:MAG TPA: DUF3857 domain-containing protein [Candidatus Saccharimonadales bacterium]|nr:DUF3857 domain-containing protein [Candidatus Saccharimonadales bacterium]
MIVRFLLNAAVVCLLAVAMAGMEKPEGWLPIAPEDQQIKDVPGYPGSQAVQLYYSYYRDDNDRFVTEYRRIKILKDGGRQYADFEVPVPSGSTLAEFAARTVHPDGSIVDLKEKPFEKTVRKARGIKFLARTFTMPAVTAGSIVEYRIKLVWNSHWVTDSVWELQSELYTVKARFRFRAVQGFVETFTDFSGDFPRSRVAYAYLNKIGAQDPQKKKDNLVELEVENVPPFFREDFMPPEDDFKPIVIFYYGAQEIASPDKFWDWLGKLWPEVTEKFIGDRKEVRELAARATAGETDPEKQLRKLYAAAQQIRNLSYERERTDVEMKRENLKSNRSVADVIEHGYGTANDINRLFAALARAGGYEASILQVADRRQHSFNKLILTPWQLVSEAVAVRIGGREVLLDPGTRHCPYGILPWTKSAATALKLGKKSSDFVTTSGTENAQVKRTANVTLAADGSIKGEIKVELNGQDALDTRNEVLSTDDAGRRKAFEELVKTWLPEGAVVKLQEAQGWDSSGGPLTGAFTIEIADFASATPSRLVVPALLFQALKTRIFQNEQRRYPIVFSWPFTETDDVTIKLPDGYMLEAPPYRRKSGLSYAGYEISSTLQENQLTTRRSLRLDTASFPPEKYYELKGFFSVVMAGDGGQAVLQAARKQAQ